MHKRVVGLAFCMAVFTVSADAQATNTFPATGNVGIGTTAPSQKLDAAGNVEIENNGVSGPPAYGTYFGSFSQQFYGSYWDHNLGSIIYPVGNIYATPTWSNSSNSGYPTSRLTLQAWKYTLNSTSGGMTDVLSVLGNGSVGIGTPAPSQTLEVNGNALVDGNLMVSANGIVFHDGTTQTTAFNPATNVSFSGVTANTVPTVTISSNPNNGGCDGCVWQALQVNALANIPGSTNVGLSVNVGGGGTNYAALFNGGNVGLGTTNPGAPLEVKGSVKLTSGSGGSITFQDGTTQSTAYTGVTCGGDYAESVDVAGDRKNYEPGDVLVIGAESGSDVFKSAEPYSTPVAGIYSTKPGTVGRRQTTDAKTSTTEVPMAMVGIVPAKVSAENGPIKRGDLLVTSSTPGYAMKGTDRSRMLGAVVGKALGALDSGTGVIEVLVTLQ